MEREKFLRLMHRLWVDVIRPREIGITQDEAEAIVQAVIDEIEGVGAGHDIEGGKAEVPEDRA